MTKVINNNERTKKKERLHLSPIKNNERKENTRNSKIE